MIPETLSSLRVPVGSLKCYDRNPRQGDVSAIAASLERHGQYRPIVVNARTQEVLAGNHTLAAARNLGWEEIAATFVDVDEDTAARIVLIDNRSNDLAGYDDAALAELLRSLPDLDGTGYTGGDLDDLLASLDGAAGKGNARVGALADRFLYPPISTLAQRSGTWRDRKREWLSLGIASEVGREGNLLNKDITAHDPNYYDKKTAVERALGRELSVTEFKTGGHYVPSDTAAGISATGTSTFDPVLAEILVRWYSPPGGLVLDPFAGGSVRGIVTACCGRAYVGIDLRPEQIAENRLQAEQILTDPEDTAPLWIEGDSRNMADLLPDDLAADLVFSCPPYFDLEVYGDDERDLSCAGDFDAFREAYGGIIAAACDRLRPDRFACWVIGEVRAKKGNGALRSMIPATIAAFEAAGLDYYNDAILVQPISTIAVTCSRAFVASRKLGRCHQYVLIFVKGSAKKATAAVGPVDVADITGADDVA